LTLETWLLFCATETVLCFTPGPAVLLVISMSLARGARGGLGASAGILAANTAYFLLSATSLGAVLLASSALFSAIKWLGAGYLIWVGARMILLPAKESTAPASTDTDPEPARRHPFWHGFVTQAANPKALVFFTALLPQFLDPTTGVPYQVAVLGVSSIVIELGVLGLYVAACHGARRWARTPPSAAPLRRLGGLLLVVAGARLAVIRRA